MVLSEFIVALAGISCSLTGCDGEIKTFSLEARTDVVCPFGVPTDKV